MNKILARKFLAPIVLMLIVFVNRKANLGLTIEDLMVCASGVVAFILGESYVDSSGAKAINLDVLKGMLKGLLDKKE